MRNNMYHSLLYILAGCIHCASTVCTVYKVTSLFYPFNIYSRTPFNIYFSTLCTSTHHRTICILFTVYKHAFTCIQTLYVVFIVVHLLFLYLCIYFFHPFNGDIFMFNSFFQLVVYLLFVSTLRATRNQSQNSLYDVSARLIYHTRDLQLNQKKLLYRNVKDIVEVF